MNPGELNKKIAFQKLETSQNSYGELTEQWVDVCTVWASIKPISAKEYYAAETVSSEVTHNVKIRYRQGLSSDMRILYNIRIFEIISPPINLNEKNFELLFKCKEVVI